VVSPNPHAIKERLGDPNPRLNCYLHRLGARTFALNPGQLSGCPPHWDFDESPGHRGRVFDSEPSTVGIRERSPQPLPPGHGDVVVGRSVREAVFRAIYTEVNARLESEALRLGQGQVMFLNEEEARQAAETNSAQVGRPWELWKAKALTGSR
jgi:hypothetical protein